MSSLNLVAAPTLLIVGGRDDIVIELNEQALARLRGPKKLQIVPGAGHAVHLEAAEAVARAVTGDVTAAR